MAPAIPICVSQRPESSSLGTKLSRALPKSKQFHIYHISTPPIKTTALCSAPPGERDDKTYVEKHFVAVAIDIEASPKVDHHSQATEHGNGSSKQQSQVLVMGVEIFVFTTAHSSVFFVSKADSTGYLHHLKLDRLSNSPIRVVIAVFLDHLLETRKREEVQSVISLFARSQGQYLFPGSIENKSKHILDDKGLVRWWCKVLNRVLESTTHPNAKRWGTVKGYLLVPGLDKYQTRAFLPKTSHARENWILGHPLHIISHYCTEYDWVPPRCLIMRFPDDPKSRFRDELDDETQSSTGIQKTGAWNSVRDLDQFWEMMAYRQECSSGQLTGFIWMVFDPVYSSIANAPPLKPSTSSEEALSKPSSGRSTSSPKKLAPTPSVPGGAYASPLKSIAGTPVKTPKPAHAKTRKKPLTGRIVSRRPCVKTQKHQHLARLAVNSPHYYWPEDGRGKKLVDGKSYDAISKLLLRLDFATLELAINSTARWVTEVGLGEGDWCMDVVGNLATEPAPVTSKGQNRANGDFGAVNDLKGLVKRKRSDTTKDEPSATGRDEDVKELSSGLVRKKLKAESESVETFITGENTMSQKVNVLSAGLVRKKPKSQDLRVLLDDKDGI